MTGKTKTKEKPKKRVLTKVEPDMSSEEIFKNLMRAFKRQGIEVKKWSIKWGESKSHDKRSNEKQSIIFGCR